MCSTIGLAVASPAPVQPARGIHDARTSVMTSRMESSPKQGGANPFGMGQRTTIVIIGLVGLIASLMCTLQAFGLTSEWEPFPAIAHGRVISAVATRYSIVDLVGFAIVVATSVIGGKTRWLVHPRVVMLTAIAALGTAISLVVRWSVIYGRYDLASTLFTVSMIAAVALLPLVADEVYAALMAHRGKRVRLESLETQGGLGYSAGITGLVVGLWLVLRPLDGVDLRAITHGHFLGAAVAAIGVLSLGQATRRARWCNVALGTWLFITPALFGFSLQGMLHVVTSGLALIVGSTFVGTEAHAPPRDRLASL